jgi:hypothetical protein
MEQITLKEYLKDLKIEALEEKIKRNEEEIKRLKEIIKFQSFSMAGIQNGKGKSK